MITLAEEESGRESGATQLDQKKNHGNSLLTASIHVYREAELDL